MTEQTVALLCAPAAFGGAQRYLVSLLAHLPRPGGRPPVLVTAAGPDAATAGPDAATAAAIDPLAAGARAAGCPVVVLPDVAQLSDPAALGAALAAHDVGAVHVNCTDPRAEVGPLRAALAIGLPVSATVHMTDRYARTPVDARAGEVWTALGAVLAPSRHIAAHLVEVTGVPAERVHHVPNGVAARPALPVREPAPGGPLLVGCLARLTRQKGLDTLVDAVALLPRGVVEVAVAGRGREEAALRERSAGLPVTWRGFAQDVDTLLGSVHAYVQPSRDDALPLALLEAAGAGLPCVATRVGDVAELLADAVLCVDPEDPAALAAALARLAADPFLRARLRAAGRARVLAGHTDAAMARATAEVLAGARPAAARG